MITPAKISTAAFNSLALTSSVLTGIDTLRFSLGLYQIDAPTSAFILLASAVPQYFMGKWNYAHFKHTHEVLRSPEPLAFKVGPHLSFPALRAAIPHLLLSAALYMGLNTIPPEVKEKLEAAATQQQAAQAQKPAASAPQSAPATPAPTRVYGD